MRFNCTFDPWIDLFNAVHSEMLMSITCRLFVSFNIDNFKHRSEVMRHYEWLFLLMYLHEQACSRKYFSTNIHCIWLILAYWQLCINYLLHLPWWLNFQIIHVRWSYLRPNNHWYPFIQFRFDWYGCFEFITFDSVRNLSFPFHYM